MQLCFNIIQCCHAKPSLPIRQSQRLQYRNGRLIHQWTGKSGWLASRGLFDSDVPVTPSTLEASNAFALMGTSRRSFVPRGNQLLQPGLLNLNAKEPGKPNPSLEKWLASFQPWRLFDQSGPQRLLQCPSNEVFLSDESWHRPCVELPIVSSSFPSRSVPWLLELLLCGLQIRWLDKNG